MYIKYMFILLLLSCDSVHLLGIRELDEIFNGDECIEGEFTLEKLETAADSESEYIIPSSNLILLKTQGINLASKATEDTSMLVELKKIAQEEKNTLNIINELAQLNKISIEFILIAEVGEPHERTYRVRLNLGDEVYIASARQIKAAKRKAALNALANTKYERPPTKTPEQIKRDVQQLTPTVYLNSIAGKLGMKVEYYNDAGNVLIDSSDKYVYYSLDSTSRDYMSELNSTFPAGLKARGVENEVHHGPFRVRVDVGDESFIGTGWTIQSARHDAAEKALEKFRKMSLQDADECLTSGQLCNKLNIKSPISLLHETAAKHQWDLAFDVISESGPAHKKLFVTRCKMSDLTTEGEGSSKKESKRKAAEAMLKMLENVQPWDLINVRGVEKEKTQKNKKKNKITRPDMLRQATMNVVDAFATIAVNDGSDGSSKSDNANEKGPKGDLLTLGRDIGIGVRFSSYLAEDDDQYGSLVSLDTNPGYHCYSKDLSAQQAEENAALSALKFLKHVGLDNIMIPLKIPKGRKLYYWKIQSMNVKN
ncbi:double-stranded RNA-binding protein Staufen homolog [Atheta coriaria]|uniref:double-stranded RNA-binding protein Staufen homolog n=1 Tax=Dalotia coriaria TaxID=877792 RepID=UPI0031F468D5